MYTYRKMHISSQGSFDSFGQPSNGTYCEHLCTFPLFWQWWWWRYTVSVGCVIKEKNCSSKACMGSAVKWFPTWLNECFLLPGAAYAHYSCSSSSLTLLLSLNFSHFVDEQHCLVLISLMTSEVQHLYIGLLNTLL